MLQQITMNVHVHVYSSVTLTGRILPLTTKFIFLLPNLPIILRDVRAGVESSCPFLSTPNTATE